MNNLFDSAEIIYVEGRGYRPDLAPRSTDERWERAFEAMHASLDETGYVSIADVMKRTGLGVNESECFIEAMGLLGYIVSTALLDRLNRYDGISNVYRWARPTRERLNYIKNRDRLTWEDDPDLIVAGASEVPA